jgi:aromatic ring hydroxylase
VRPQFGDNAATYLEFARDHDLCLSHALHDPPMDKSLRPEQDPDRCLRIIDERDDGLIVRGARTMSTFSPLSNEILVYPAYPLNEREREFSIFFAVAVATPGLKLLCREPFTRDRSPFDHPAAARFDEQDAVVIFDDVFVPWERAFVAQAPAVTSQLLRGQAMAWAGFSADLVLLEKMEVLIGVCHLLARSGGIDTQPFVIEELATLIEHIGTSSLIMTPSAADMQVPELRPFIERYFRGKNTSAEQRIKLSKLAWDLSCDAFGGRQTLYERLYSGDPHGLMALTYRTYDLTHAVSQAQRLLELDTGA